MPRPVTPEMTPDEQEIRTLIERWLDATTRGDVDTVLSLLDDDVRFLLPGQSPLDKHDFATTQRAAARFDLEIRHEIREVKVCGDLAYCWNHLEVDIRTPGETEPFRRAGNALSILQRKAGRWVVLRDVNLLGDL